MREMKKNGFHSIQLNLMVRLRILVFNWNIDGWFVCIYIINRNNRPFQMI